jgi:hypothetical protein
MEAHEFLLQHHLFRSDRTGEIINPDMLHIAYPKRWKYDILRALEYFRRAEAPVIRGASRYLHRCLVIALGV